MKRRNKALELLVKSKEDFYEQQIKRKDRMNELRLEIANARTSEQKPDKAFVLLNKELNKLKEEESLPRDHHSPVLSDFYTPSKEMHEYQIFSTIIIGGIIEFVGYKIYKIWNE